MKKILQNLIVPVIFLAGLSLLLYPLVSNQWNNYRQDRLITSYDAQVAQKEDAGVISYDAELVQAQDYNNALKPYILPDSFANAKHSEGPDERYMSCLNLTGDGMMGYVEIPRIGVKIPVFHTVDEDVLAVAAGHLEGSSLPIGGEGSHAVISAHRGLPSATLFTDLDQLTKGDCFLLYILDDVLCYRVDQISVVEPEDTTALAAVDGKDLVTLLTCTPYGINSHRLLVRGERVPYEEIADEMVAASSRMGASLHTNYLLWVIVGLLVTGGFILLLYFFDKKRNVPRPETDGEGDIAKTSEGSGEMSEKDSEAILESPEEEQDT